jgi:peroxiredoxin
VVLVNTVLTLRLVRRLRAQDAIQDNLDHGSHTRLSVGQVAPDFRAASLAGQEITHDRLAGSSVAFVFVSPNCGGCRNAIATVVQVAPLAQRAAGVQIVVVSDSGATKTRAWLDSLREEDELRVAQPLLVAPLSQYDMIAHYNPDGLFPYFCLVDAERHVMAYGPVGRPEWEALVRTWRAADGARDPALT